RVLAGDHRFTGAITRRARAGAFEPALTRARRSASEVVDLVEGVLEGVDLALGGRLDPPEGRRRADGRPGDRGAGGGPGAGAPLARAPAEHPPTGRPGEGGDRQDGPERRPPDQLRSTDVALDIGEAGDQLGLDLLAGHPRLGLGLDLAL